MRCPKCKYISFDNTNRCRNCGYEFALTVEDPPLDLPIVVGDDALGPLADFAISEEPVESASPARSRPITSVFDLPLFRDRAPDDDRPLVTPAAVPRQPLAVRRSSPVIPRPAPATDEPGLDLAGEPDQPPPRHRPQSPSVVANAGAARRPDPASSSSEVEPAGLPGRLFAGLADAVILVGLCSAVLYITLQVCGLRLDELRALPLAPLGGFLLLLVGGYFVLLTAADGQTIGKMAAGIRVVPMRDADRVSLGEAAMRAAGYLVSVLPAGLGLIPAVIHADRRALHDRLADTRVVKA